MTPETSSQKKIGAVLFYGIVIVLAYLTFLVFAPFLVPLAWAAILVVVSYAVYEKLAKRWGATRAALAATVGVTLLLIVPTVLVMVQFVRQAVDAVQGVQVGVQAGHYSWVTTFWTHLQERFPSILPDDLGGLLRSYANRTATYVAERLGTLLRHTAEFVFHLSVTILAMFYLYRDGDSLVARLRELLPFEKDHRDRMMQQIRELIFASVTSSLAAAMAHGLLGGIAFWLTGVQAPIFWGVMMGFFSLVPVVGSALIWVPISISLMAGGHLGRGIFLVIVCCLIVGVVDNVLRPWLIGGRTQMGGLVVFISVLGGIAVFGPLGTVLGPIVVALAGSMLDVYAPSSPHRNTASKAGGKKNGGVLE